VNARDEAFRGIEIVTVRREQLRSGVARYMRYSGETVEIFGWTPSGQSIPCLRSYAIGESVGDHAFVDERAMYWDGDAWLPLLWKDFAVWTKAVTAPKRRVTDVKDGDDLGVGDGEVDHELPVRAE
jgi:hypothetical protein